MKKCLKTLTALCLTVALLSTMLVCPAFAAEPILVDWYGFDYETVSVEVGDGTYSQAPVFFPQDAADTGVTWSSDNTDVATVDPATGVVTLVAEGTANITAALTGDTSGLDDASLTAGASYTLTVTPTTGIAGTLKVRPSGVVLNHPATSTLTVTGAAGNVSAVIANDTYATASVQGGEILVTSKNVGYTDLTVTDGTNTLVIPVSVVAVDPAATKANWLSLFPDAASIGNDPGYLQWYFETATTASAGVLGYGVNPSFNVLNAYENYNASNDRIRFNPASNYSYFQFDGFGMTVTDYYHVFAIKMPMAGTVSVGSLGEARFEYSSSSDGAFFGIFKTTDNGGGTAETHRVFPEEVSANKQGAYTAEVLNNWMWLYPNNMSIGETTYDKTLTQADVDRLAAFNKDGAVFDVQKDDIVRIVMHAGANNYSDSGIRFLPSIKYVVDEVNDVLDLDREISVAAGQTTVVTPRIDPYWMAPEVTLTAEYADTTDATLDSVTYLTGTDLGKVDLTIAGTTAGTGYYRLDFGPVSKLVKITIGAGAGGSSDLEITFNRFQLGNLRWKVTNTVQPLFYTAVAMFEETNADGSIKIDTSTLLEELYELKTLNTNYNASWSIGNTYKGKTADIFFFTDPATLTMPSANAYELDYLLP